jgi:uncharacterized protein YjiS (DUF1127 family)
MTTLSQARSARRATTSLFTAFLRALFGQSRRRRSLAELDGLDDNLLKDVGLSRLDIDMMRRHW